MYAIYEKSEIQEMMCDVFNEPLNYRIIVELNTKKSTNLDYYMFDRSDGFGNVFEGVRITANYELLLYIENVDFDKAVEYIMTLVNLYIVKRIYTESY